MTRGRFTKDNSINAPSTRQPWWIINESSFQWEPEHTGELSLQSQDLVQLDELNAVAPIPENCSFIHSSFAEERER